MGDELKRDEAESEETAHYDDAVIGRALRWSLAALVILGIAGAGLFFLLNRKKPAPAAKQTKLSAPVLSADPTADVPKVPFVDVTEAAGIHFRQNNGASGDKLLPETMGGGVAFFDFDNDGNQDLLLVNGTYWPGKIPEGKKPTTAALFHNDGNGHFVDV